MCAVNGDSSPMNARHTPGKKSSGHVDISSHAKAPPLKSLGWGPDAPTSPSLEATPAAAPYPVGEALSQSVQFLTESLKSERKRADELEARRLQLEEANAALRAELRAAQDKAFQAMVSSKPRPHPPPPPVLTCAPMDVTTNPRSTRALFGTSHTVTPRVLMRTCSPVSCVPCHRRLAVPFCELDVNTKNQLAT